MSDAPNINTEKMIILADDDVSARDALQVILEAAGYTVVTVPDGAAVCAVLTRLQPRALIVSAQLSGKSGLECYRWVRTQKNLARLPVLLALNLGDSEILNDAIAAGVTGMLLKPFIADTVIASLKKSIHRASEGRSSSVSMRRVLRQAVRETAPPPPSPSAPAATESIPATTPDHVAPQELPADSSSVDVNPAAPTLASHDVAAASEPNTQDEADIPADDDLQDAHLTKEDAELFLGEYDDSTVQDIEFSHATESTATALTISDDLMQIIRKRLAVVMEIDRLHETRKTLQADKDLPVSLLTEVRRQIRETSDLPDAKTAANLIAQRETALGLRPDAAAKSTTAPTDDHANADHASDDDEKKTEPPHPRFDEIHQLALTQWRQCLQRHALTSDVLNHALPTAAEEPLYKILLQANLDIDADALFGWGIYGLALAGLSEAQNQKRETIRQALDALPKEPTGIFGKFRKETTEIGAERAALREQEETLKSVQNSLRQEIRLSEKEMVAVFWEAYAGGAELLVSGNLTALEEPHVRAFLRYGMIGCAPHFLGREVAEHILKECAQAEREWSMSMAAEHVLYADEYIFFIAHSFTTPSVNEELELTGMHTPPWKADRARRRIHHTVVREASLRELAENLAGRCEVIQQERMAIEERMAKYPAGTTPIAEAVKADAQEIQRLRVEGARLERVQIRIHDVFIPRQLDRRAEAVEREREAGATISVVELARQEAKAIHKVTRLTARLKDPFLPFVLRNNFSLEKDVINPRALVLAELATIEKSDVEIFKDELFSIKKATHRIYLRFAPTVLLAPGCGFLAYSWSPRAGPDTGRLVLPAYMPRTGLREKMLLDLLADFRWDTSKASSGVDSMAMDTVVAAYANVRWQYRRRSKEVREKAGFLNKETDRQSWRRHYQLYITSIEDGGKKLFFKCKEVYEMFIQFIGLPEGIERLRR